MAFLPTPHKSALLVLLLSVPALEIKHPLICFLCFFCVFCRICTSFSVLLVLTWSLCQKLSVPEHTAGFGSGQWVRNPDWVGLVHFLSTEKLSLMFMDLDWQVFVFASCFGCQVRILSRVILIILYPCLCSTCSCVAYQLNHGGWCCLFCSWPTQTVMTSFLKWLQTGQLWGPDCAACGPRAAIWIGRPWANCKWTSFSTTTYHGSQQASPLSLLLYLYHYLVSLVKYSFTSQSPLGDKIFFWFSFFSSLKHFCLLQFSWDLDFL